ncbi:MAG: hypothetical protein Q7T55_06490 [Solirubrobacteraceae bacterium]|nr:hypothetical protein [Solirubrobacteraceae bacterium]
MTAHGGGAAYDWLFRVTNNNCDTGWGGWNGISASITNGGPIENEPYVPVGTSANLYAAAPAGAGIERIHVDSGRLASHYGNATGWSARVMVPSSGFCRTDGDGGNWCGLGRQRSADNSAETVWASPSYPQITDVDLGPITGPVSDIAIGVVCNGGSTYAARPCYRMPYKNSAGVAVASGFIRVRDNTPPTISGISGPVADGQWHRPGDIALSVTGWDNTGIRAFERYIDGEYRGEIAQACDYSQMKPCQDRAIDTTAPVGGYDGFHTVEMAAYAATNTEVNCSIDCAVTGVKVAIDGTAPGAPASKNNGPAWSNANAFNLNAPTPASENDPDGDGPQARSPITRRIAVVCPGSSPEGSACVTKDVSPVNGSGQVASAAVAVPGEGAWNARIQLVDQVGNASDIKASAPVPVRLDQSPPTAAVSTSPLTIKVTTGDALSGPASIKYRVDGKGEWSTVAKAAVDVTAEAGRRFIEVQATDAAGNAMAKPQRFDITVPDSTGSAPRTPQTVGGDSQITLADRGELNGAGASEKATLTAWFVRKSSKDKKRDLTVRTIGERNTAAIQGTLINGENQPIRNARIDLQASIAGGRVETSKDVARTDNEGNFAAKLNKGQTSRKLAVRYVERVNDEVATSAVGLELVVKARVALSVHAPKRGNRWKLSGFVSSGYLTKQGVQVQLQWRSPRDGWTDLRTVRTDAKGRFKYFRRMSGHYRLRARVASTPAYAYKGNVSRTVRGGGHR